MDDLATVSVRQLRRVGVRITPQRKLVLDILAQGVGHLDAYDIFERGRHRDAHLSLSTVYRTLSLLKDEGLVRELHLDAEQHHYELADKDDHTHLVCNRCGRVLEVDSAPFAEAAVAACEKHGFEIESAEVEVVGLCAKCRQGDLSAAG